MFLVTQSLRETVCFTFLEFENAMERDVSPMVGPMGSIHGLTNYVTNYVVCMYLNKASLPDLFHPQEFEPDPSFSPNKTEIASEEEESPFAPLARWTLDMLCFNLENKARELLSTVESHFFLMTNFHYIVRKVKGSELREAVGDSWLRQKAELVRRHAQEYQVLTWGKFLELVSESKTAESAEMGRKGLKV